MNSKKEILTGYVGLFPSFFSCVSTQKEGLLAQINNILVTFLQANFS